MPMAGAPSNTSCPWQWTLKLAAWAAPPLELGKRNELMRTHEETKHAVAPDAAHRGPLTLARRFEADEARLAKRCAKRKAAYRLRYGLDAASNNGSSGSSSSSSSGGSSSSS